MSAKAAKPQKWKSRLFSVCKFALAAAIIWWLVSEHYGDFASGLANFNYLFLVPAGVAYFSHMLICGWRWYKLAKVAGVEISLGEAVAVTMQGYFWSLVIPGGAIGGDFARVAIVARRSPKGAKADGVLSILMDRIVGMVALFVLTIGLVACSVPQLMRVEVDGHQFSAALKICGIVGLDLLCVSGIAAMLVLFFHRALCKIRWIDAVFKFGDRRTDGMVSKMTGTIDLYARKWRLLSVLTVVSVFFVHLMTVVAVMFLIRGLGFEFNLLAVVTAVTIGNIVGLLPFTVSGIGMRDAAILVLLRAGGMNEEVSSVVPVMYTCLILAFNLVGALFFVFDSGRGRAK